MGRFLFALLAHQGGWDEVLLIAGPIAVIAGLLWVAKRRVDAAAGDERGQRDESTSLTDDSRPGR